MSAESDKSIRDKNNKNLFLVVICVILATIFIPFLFMREGSKKDKEIIAESIPRLNSLDNERSRKLANEKIREEILELRLKNRSQDLEIYSTFGSLITSAVGFGGILITLWKTSQDFVQQRKEDREQKDREIEKKGRRK